MAVAEDKGGSLLAAQSWHRAPIRLFALFVLLACGTSWLQAVTLQKKKKRVAAAKSAVTATVALSIPAPGAVASRSRAKKASYSPWRSPTYADSTEGDNVDGEDLVVRRAA